MARVTRRDFQRLLEFRVALREFQRWSEAQAEAAGLTHVQHQLLVAIKGHPGNQPPTVGDLAGYLLLRPHSTVELIDRAEGAGLVERIPDRNDGRVVRVRLTKDGDRIVQRLTKAHLGRLHELAAVLDELVARHGAEAANDSEDRRAMKGLPAPAGRRRARRESVTQYFRGLVPVPVRGAHRTVNAHRVSPGSPADLPSI
jgi:DNA-binding MarR family transcriptional regulator